MTELLEAKTAPGLQLKTNSKLVKVLFTLLRRRSLGLHVFGETSRQKTLKDVVPFLFLDTSVKRNYPLAHSGSGKCIAAIAS